MFRKTLSAILIGSMLATSVGSTAFAGVDPIIMRKDQTTTESAPDKTETEVTPDNKEENKATETVPDNKEENKEENKEKEKEEAKKECSELKTSESHMDINLSNNGKGNIKTTSIASLLAKRNKRF